MHILKRADSHAIKNVRLVGEGLNEIVEVDFAFSKADEAGLDLVCVSDKSDPLVVRVLDFKKIQYEQKKAKSTRPKSSELKEIQLKVNISDHDLATKMSAIERFLSRGDKVKVLVRLKGRERENPERARALLMRVTENVPCKVNRLPGPMTIAILEPVKTTA